MSSWALQAMPIVPVRGNSYRICNGDSLFFDRMWEMSFQDAAKGEPRTSVLAAVLRPGELHATRSRAG